MFRKPFLFVSLFCLLLLAVNVGASSPRQEPTVEPLAASAALGTTFTYQGQLKSGGELVNANCSMAFRLYDDVSSGNLVGNPITTTVPIGNGQFAVGLDFGAVFDGDARWLDIRVMCPGDSSYITLTPRQPLNPTPYALQVAQLTAYNPNNRGASVNLDWYNDWPRIRYGGNGTGAANGFLIQGQGDSTKMTILDNGDVSIGTPNDRARLTIESGSNQRAVYLSGGPSISFTDLRDKWNLPTTNSGSAALPMIASDWDTGGGFGIIQGDNVASPMVWMYEATGRNAFTVARKGFSGTGSNVLTISAKLSPLFQVRENGNVGIGTTSPQARLDVVGVIRVSDSGGNPVVEIGEGLDYAETFTMSGEQAVLSGMVVVIDPEHPGALRLSTEAYDTRVAGVIAGANGLGSGVRLGDDVAGGQPVALAGRVYCYVDASSGAIQPGDLLTTSSTPGYAMKVSNYAQAQGAILGKAMEPLAQGEKGMILILVTLQ